MERKIVEELVKWKEKKQDRMPLLIHGARQVGKTYIIKEFGEKYYKNVVYINFERMDEICTIFESDISPEKIVPLLEINFNTKIIPEQTLIIFDEVQVCNRALTSLKYFQEEAPEYQIIAAGSLLGVAINMEDFSFPVGKVEMLYMYPLDFEEFLWAIGKKDLSELMKEYYNENKEFPFHEMTMELYKKYLMTGGMPSVVNRFVQTNTFEDVYDMKEIIYNSYIVDMTKYATKSESLKIISAYDSIPNQLAKENKKFQYKVIQKGGNSAMFGESIEWLLSSGIALKCKKVEHGKFPIISQVDLSSFKLYMSDVGLLTYKAGIDLASIILNKPNELKGALAENYVAQQLQAKKYELYYWESNSQAEVDFIIQKNGDVIPIEVKAEDNVKSRSLNVYVDKYKPPYAIRISSKNFGLKNNIKSVPLYAVHLI